MNTQRTEFDVGGVVISLDSIIGGAKLGVVEELKNDLKSTEDTLLRLDDDRAELLERVDAIELLIARGDAKRDALKLAIEAAEKVLT